MEFSTIQSVKNESAVTLVGIHGEKGTWLPRLQYKLSALFQNPAQLREANATQTILTFQTADKNILQAQLSENSDFFQKVSRVSPGTGYVSHATMRINGLQQDFTLRQAGLEEKEDALVYEKKKPSQTLAVLIEPKND